MAGTQNEWVRLKLREMLMRGEFAPGYHLQEIPLAEQLGVSRTPVRLALGALAHEGLLSYTPQRGFLVRGFSVKGITDAIDVRGDLEAMACGIVARQGLEEAQRHAIQECLEASEALMARDHLEPQDLEPWFAYNSTFHNTLVEAAGNETIARFMEHFNSIPLAAAGVVAATLSNLKRVRRVFLTSNEMHGWIFDAIEQRQPERAAFLMREHVYQGREGLRSLLQSLQAKESAEHETVFRLVQTGQDGS